MSEQQEPGFKPVAPMPVHKDSHKTSPIPHDTHTVAPMPAPISGFGTNPDGSAAKQSSVLAILALIGGILCLLMPLLALPALIISILGLKQTAGNKQTGRGMAIAGLVMSILGMLGMLFWATILIIGFASSKNVTQDFNSSVQNSTSSSSSSSSTDKKTLSGTMKTPLVADRYTLTVNTIDRAFKPTRDYYTPKSGNEYVLVSVTIKNNDTYAHSFSSYDFKVRDASGEEHSDKFMTDIPNELSYKSIEPGSEITGNIVYELPVGGVQQVLVYDPGFFSDQQAEISL